MQKMNNAAVSLILAVYHKQFFGKKICFNAHPKLVQKCHVGLVHRIHRTYCVRAPAGSRNPEPPPFFNEGEGGRKLKQGKAKVLKTQMSIPSSLLLSSASYCTYTSKALKCTICKHKKGLPNWGLLLCKLNSDIVLAFLHIETLVSNRGIGTDKTKKLSQKKLLIFLLI